MIWALLVVPLMVLANRFRGGGFGASHLPGHPRFWTTPLVFLIAWIAVPWVWALAFSLGWLLWCWPPWGLLMCLGRWEPQRDISPIETTLLRYCGGSYRWALFARHLLVFPALFAVAFLGGWWLLPVMALPFAAWVVASYSLGWWMVPAEPIMVGELLTGAAWGILILLATV